MKGGESERKEKGGREEGEERREKGERTHKIITWKDEVDGA